MSTSCRPKVSVIVPVYNAQKYLPESIRSILAQTYTDYELIIVDDGSTDQSVSVIKNFQKKHPDKITLIQKENGGPASARNVGIKAAAGEYIAFNDADDLWLRSKLQRQLAFFEVQSPEVGIVYTERLNFDHEGLYLVSKHRQKFAKGSIYRELLKSNFIPNNSVMVRRKCFDVVGLFDESLGIIEDYDMWLRIALKYQISFLPEVLSLYRLHPEGRSKNYEITLKRNIRVIRKQYAMLGDATVKITKEIRSALSQRLADLAFFYLKKGKPAWSRHFFKTSIITKFRPKTLLYYVLTYLSLRILIIFDKLTKFILGIGKKQEVEKLMLEDASTESVLRLCETIFTPPVRSHQ